MANEENIVGERIKAARFAQNLTLRELSRRTTPRLSHSTIHQYERGDIFPSTHALESLAAALDVSVDHLLGGDGKVSKPMMMWRRETDANNMAALAPARREELQETLVYALDRYLEIETQLTKNLFLDMPEEDSLNALRIQKFDQFAEDEKREFMEQKAEEARKLFALAAKPIYSMTRIMEDNYVKVIQVDAPEEIHNLFCYVQRTDHPFKNPTEVIAVSTQANKFRQRFMLACKLAHRLLDTGFGLVFGYGHGYLGEGTPDDRKRQAKFESHVEYLAGAFLMPRKPLAAETEKLNLKKRGAFTEADIMHMRDLYGAPIGAVINRLHQAGHIGKQARDNLLASTAWDIAADTYEKDGVLGNQPESTTDFLETPRRLKNLIITAFRKQAITRESAEALLAETRLA